MSIITRMLAAAVVIALPVVAAAQTDAPAPAVPDSPASRLAAEEVPADEAFTMVPAEGRHLKIDRRTGRVSVCEEKAGAWSCRLIADDRLAYEEEIARLEAQTMRLETRVAELEAELGRRDETWIGPDEEKKLDEFLDFSDKALRRFFGMVEDLKRDLGEPNSL